MIGQAFAAQGLAVAGSGKADEALKFLLKQQCGKGWFRLNFAADKTKNEAVLRRRQPEDDQRPGHRRDRARAC